MGYTIWHDGTLIGRSDLEMATADPSARQGQVVPEPGFERAWADVGPIMNEIIDLAMALGSRVSEIPDVPDETATERGQRVHDWLVAQPAAARMRALEDARAALGLQVRDAAGQVIPARSILIAEVRLPDFISMADIERTVAEARAAGLETGLEIRFPRYIVTVVNPPGDTSVVR